MARMSGKGQCEIHSLNLAGGARLQAYIGQHNSGRL